MARYAKQRKEYLGWIPTKDDILWMVKWWAIAIVACLALAMLGVAQGHAQWGGDDKHNGPVTIRTYPHIMLEMGI